MAKRKTHDKKAVELEYSAGKPVRKISVKHKLGVSTIYRWAKEGKWPREHREGKHPGGRPRAYTSPEEMQQDIDLYFFTCEKEKRPKTMSGLANALRMDRKSLLNYKNRDRFFHTVKKAREIVQQYVEEYLFQGKNTAGAIFNLKNNFGWKDKQEVEQSGEIKLRVVYDEGRETDEK